MKTMKRIFSMIVLSLIAFSCYSQTIINAPDVAIKSDSILFVDAQRSAKHLPLSTMTDWVKGELSTENEVIKGSWLHQQNYDFHVEASEYIIQNTYHDFFIESDITLSVGDATFDRIDIVVVNNIQTFSVIEGEPSIIPHEPDVADNQAVLFFVLVKANTTEPGGVQNILVYDEHTGEPSEWNSTSNESQVDLDYSGDAYTGTTSMQYVTIFSNGSNRFETTSIVDIYNIQSLSMWVKFVSVFNNQKLFDLQGRSSINEWKQISLTTSDFGLDGTNTTDWQLLVVPSIWFTDGLSDLEKLYFSISTSGITFLIDNVNIQLIDGITTPIDPTQQTLTFNETTNVLGISDGNEVDLNSLAGGGTANEYSDALFKIFNNIDNTKEILFDASAITTANSRTITMPDEDVDLGDFVTQIGVATQGKMAIFNDDKVLVPDAPKYDFTTNQFDIFNNVGGENTSIRIGQTFVDNLSISANSNGLNTTMDFVSISTASTSAVANAGTIKFNIDGVPDLLVINDVGIQTPNIIVNNGTDLNVLLDGGGTKLLTDFALSTDLSGYVDLTTAQSISGLKTFSSKLTASDKFEVGILHTLTGNNSSALGVQHTVSGLRGFATGTTNTASASNSYAGGASSVAGGASSIAYGPENYARSLGEASFGRYGTDYTSLSNDDDRVLNIGNGNSTAAKSDALTVLKGGKVLFPSLNIGQIIDVKSAVTKEYVDTNITGTNSGVNTGDQDLSGYLLNTTDTLTGNLTVTGEMFGNIVVVNGMVNNLASQGSGGYDFMEWTSNVTGSTQIPLWRNPSAFEIVAITFAWIGDTALNIGAGEQVDFEIGYITNNTSAEIANFNTISSLFTLDSTYNGLFASGEVEFATPISLTKYQNLGIVGTELGAITPNSGELSISLLLRHIP